MYTIIIPFILVLHTLPIAWNIMLGIQSINIKSWNITWRLISIAWIAVKSWFSWSVSWWMGWCVSYWSYVMSSWPSIDRSVCNNRRCCAMSWFVNWCVNCVGARRVWVILSLVVVVVVACWMVWWYNMMAICWNILCCVLITSGWMITSCWMIWSCRWSNTR